MTPSPDATDDAVTRACAGIPALLDLAPALVAREPALTKRGEAVLESCILP